MAGFRSWLQQPFLLLPLFALGYVLSYVLGAVLYLEPALVSALWPGNGFALGMLLALPRRLWLPLLVLQGVLHLILGTIDIGFGFAVGVTLANMAETITAAMIIRHWCSGDVRLDEPAHVGRMLGGAVVGVVPGSILGALTVYGVYGNTDLLSSAQSWLLADLIGILVLTPAVIGLRSFASEIRVAGLGELVLASIVFLGLAWLVCFTSSAYSIPILSSSLLWIPLLWLGIRGGPSLAALAAAIGSLFLVGGADLNRGPFVVPGRSPEDLALSSQVFIAIFCAGTLLIAASSAAYRRAMQAIGGNAERLRITLASIGDGVIATDAQGRVELLNPVASQLTGWSANMAVGRPLKEIFPIVSSLTGLPTSNPVDRVLSEGVTVDLADHTDLIHRDGSKRQIADSAAPIRDSSGAIVGAVLVFRDVTERHRLEDRLRQTEKLEAIGRLSSGIAHDLNNMLGGVMGGAELLQGRVGNDERLQKPVRMILVAVERMRELNARLLAFARREPAARRTVAVDRLVEECAELLRHGLDRRFTVDTICAAGDVQVSVDRAQFQSALLNLAVNARDAMPQGGLLRIATSRRRHQDRDEVLIAVQDHGTGMTPDVRARLFEPFFTTKPSGLGTGLGLHAVQTCMRAHDGNIEIDTTLGVGTTVTLILPQVTAPKVEIPQPVSAPLRVLLVDDDPAVRDSTQAQLEDLGFTVTTAEDGMVGLAALHDGGTFDAVVLDVVMPRMDGLEMLRVLRQTHPELPVLLVSGRLPEVEIASLLALGPTALLAKPYRLTDLRRALDELRAIPRPT